MENTNPTRTRNLEASNKRKALVTWLKEEGYLNPSGYTVTLIADGTGTKKHTLPLTDFVGITEAEIKGAKLPTPKPVDKEAVKAAISGGQLSIEDMEAILKEAKKAK